MLKRHRISFVFPVYQLNKFVGQLVLSNSLGGVIILFLHNGCNLGQGNEGEELQVALNSVVWGANEEL